MRSVRRVWWVAAPFVLMVPVTACQVTHPPNPSLISVSPAQAYTDGPVELTLTGTDFRPALSIDTAGGTVYPTSPVLLIPHDPSLAGAAVTAQSTSWVSAQMIYTSTPAGLAAGSYDVQVVEPAGRTALIASAFTSLGPDRQPPTVTIQQPAAGTIVGPTTKVVGQISADDGPGYVQAIQWSATSISLGQVSGPPCAADPQNPVHQLGCTFSFVAPEIDTPLETIEISAFAQDTAGNQASATGELEVAWIPGVTSVSPLASPVAGGTTLAIDGVHFIPGVSKILIDGVPIDPDGGGGTVVSDQQMTGTTVAHPPGIFALVVANGTGQSAVTSFQFVLPPVLRAVTPTSGPGSSPTTVTLVGDNFGMGAQVYIDDGVNRVLLKSTVSSPYVIQALIPAGSGVISIEVFDPTYGQSELANAFHYTAAPPPTYPTDGGAP